MIELIILSQMHFSEFNLVAWLCQNLRIKVVGFGRAVGEHRRSPGNQAQIPLEISEINRRSPGNKQTNPLQIPGENQMQIPKTTTINWHQLEFKK